MGMDRSSLLLLERYNPWLADQAAWPGSLSRFLPDPIIPRSVSIPLDSEQVGLVVGPRQAGKSTLIALRLRGLTSPPLIVNLDDPGLRKLCPSGAAFLNAIDGLGARPSVFVFEEVQQLDEAGLFLKSLVDLRSQVPILATGSSAYHLRSRTRESLAGRAHRITLLPLSLPEVLGEPAAPEPPTRRALLEDARTSRMALWGGYPRVWLEEDERLRETLLVEMVESLLLRDASDLYRVRRPDAFRRTLEIVASRTGNLLNTSDVAASAGVSVPTVQSYLEMLEESHILRLVRPFLGGKRAEIVSTPKIFFIDNGIRNLLHGGFGPLDARGDKGALMENLVFSELVKSLAPMDDLRFYRTRNGSEVDFVVRRRDRLVAIEVKAGGSSRPIVPRVARSFIEAYTPARFLIVHAGLAGQEVQVGETAVRFIHPARVSEEVGDALR
jgi:uncharacterized protein